MSAEIETGRAAKVVIDPETILVTLLAFALAPGMQAISPAPDGGYLEAIRPRAETLFLALQLGHTQTFIIWE